MPPIGYLECNGQSTLSYPALAAVVGATVPDSGRVFGSWQIDEFKSHSHFYNRSVSTNGNGDYPAMPGMGGTFSNTTIGAVSTTGSNETRPRNIALLPCIKY